MDPKTSPAESMMAFMEASDFLLGPNLNGDYMTDVENVDGKYTVYYALLRVSDDCRVDAGPQGAVQAREEEGGGEEEHAAGPQQPRRAADVGPHAHRLRGRVSCPGRGPEMVFSNFILMYIDIHNIYIYISSKTQL